MTIRRVSPVVAVLAVGLLITVGCADGAGSGSRSSAASAPGQTPCTDAVASIVSATERYVRGYESGRAVSASSATQAEPVTTTSAPGAAGEVMTETEFQTALTAAEGTIRGQNCDRTNVRTDLATGLQAVSAKGPVADAVLRQLTASLTGRAANTPTVTRVGVGDDLRDALAMSAVGSTLELEAGEYHLDGPLVVLIGVVIRGAGRDATTIVSSAPEAAVFVLTDQRVELSGLTVRHDGDAPASVVLGGPAASVVVSNARLTGARADAASQGGAGILMYSTTGAPPRGTTLEVTDVEVRDNEAAGIVLTGAHRSSVVRTLFASNGQCGMCFIGDSGGSVEDSAFEQNGIGVAATGTAAPALLRITVTGGEVGLQVTDTAAPTVAGATITGSARAAVIYVGPAAGSLDDVSCVDVPFGIVVGTESHPQLGNVDCEFISGQ